MPDRHTPEQRSYNMSRIRSTGTAPERRLGELLQSILPDTEIISHAPDLPGKPDCWIPSLKLAVFADSCFFHRCPKHFVMPGQNVTYWKAKITRNKKRDRRVNGELKSMGITPVRIWEHNLKRDTSAAVHKIRRAIRAARKAAALTETA